MREGVDARVMSTDTFHLPVELSGTVRASDMNHEASKDHGGLQRR